MDSETYMCFQKHTVPVQTSSCHHIDPTWSPLVRLAVAAEAEAAAAVVLVVVPAAE